MNPDTKKSGVFAELIFVVKADADTGETQIGLSYDEDEIFNSKFQNVSFDTRNGKVRIIPEIEEIIWVAPNTSVNDFAKSLNISGITVKDSKGNTISGKIFVGTGSLVVFNDDTVVSTVIVKGDTDGTGKIDSTDYIIVKRHILIIKELENVYLKAADTDKNGKIDATDYILIKRHILNIKKLA